MRKSSLEDRLKRMARITGSGLGGTPARAQTLPPRYRRLAEAVGGELVSGPAGTFCRVTRRYPFGHPYGVMQLNRPDDDGGVALASFSAHEVDGETQLNELLFFDTETTGLGGTGAVPFLIGCGSLTTTGFEIRQYLLPDYSDEAAMLEEILTEFEPGRTAVSYNGAAFDITLLRARLIINRVAREVPCAGHIDLLHPTRRLYRRRLSDCSLTNVEREILRFFRSDDVPGYLVPSIYFDWLEAENTDQLDQVLEHNRLDILTLFFLLTHIDEVFRSDGSNLYHSDDIYSLSRVFGRRRRHDKIVANYERLDNPLPAPLTPEMLLYHAMAFKRSGELNRAVELWTRLAETESREAFDALTELAKYHEHCTRDFGQACHRAVQAVELCPSEGPLRRAALHRLDRLRRKLTPES